MMLFIAFPKTLEYLQAGFLRGFPHLYRLETALQRGVFLDIAAVLVQGGGPDYPDLPPAQSGLDNVGGVHGPLGGTGPHDGVQLIDEENHVSGLLHLVQQLFDPLLKFAPVLGSGHHAGQVQRENPFVR